jgi:two-component sensor histidine kinase
MGRAGRVMFRNEETGGLSADDFVLHEMHHRVSNHLQILASVVGLQAREHDSAEGRDALFDVRRRILAIARLDSQLQRGAGGGLVEISHFLDRNHDGFIDASEAPLPR